MNDKCSAFFAMLSYKRGYKAGYKQAMTDFVENITLPLTKEEDIESILERLEQLKGE